MIPRYCKLGHLLVDSRVEDSKFVDSKVGFFSKIGALWIQAHILFIFHITIFYFKLNEQTKYYTNSATERDSLEQTHGFYLRFISKCLENRGQLELRSKNLKIFNINNNGGSTTMHLGYWE
ncbi:unnamed protein product [Spirodela intermedia]|uniref:Uncharacterized protein n=1 Tax=Spirodela intermedia TaxID=51605 RepID=A0A7I8J6L3_SPIIN|nr:unnamed protein product [Spirodela intermedia]CAA6665888.1 unnamed protein product [Spirodela intermedia]